MYHKLSRRFKQFGVAHSYLLTVFLTGVFTFTSAYTLSFPAYITTPLERVGEFFRADIARLPNRDEQSMSATTLPKLIFKNSNELNGEINDV